MTDAQMPLQALIVDRTQESASTFSLALRFVDDAINEQYHFQPGQFNMLYLFGIGEIPISIVSSTSNDSRFIHTIKVVGRVTRAMSQLRPGDQIGVRGPYGNGWPIRQAEGRDILLVLGGLGCAPSVSVIHHVMQRRQDFGRLAIIQGVNHKDDLIWRSQYDQWMHFERTQVLLAADVADASWTWHKGLVTDLISQVELDIPAAISMICGPEPMMIAAADHIIDQGASEESIWLSMERNMQCAVGLCGHCQFGSDFVCKDGPVLNYAHIRERLHIRGI